MSQFPLLILLALAAASHLAHGADDEPRELAEARGVYQKELEFATHPIRDRYLSRLNTIKRNLGSRGEARAAVAVQDEIDIIKAPLMDPSDIAKFAGTWKITYKSGDTGKFVIRSNGAVQWTEENSAAIQRKGRIVWKSPGFLLEFEDNLDRLWHLTLAESVLSLEFFQPRSSYPKGPPQNQGTGVRIAVTKP